MFNVSKSPNVGTFRNIEHHFNFNFVNREIKSSKSNYYCNLIEEGKGDSSLVWKAVNEASSRSASSAQSAHPSRSV